MNCTVPGPPLTLATQRPAAHVSSALHEGQAVQTAFAQLSSGGQLASELHFEGAEQAIPTRIAPSAARRYRGAMR
ncbi:MAG: hypothetical protein ACYC8T_15595 [Myxococcaceae bacterium]